MQQPVLDVPSELWSKLVSHLGEPITQDSFNELTKEKLGEGVFRPNETKRIMEAVHQLKLRQGFFQYLNSLLVSYSPEDKNVLFQFLAKEEIDTVDGLLYLSRTQLEQAGLKPELTEKFLFFKSLLEQGPEEETKYQKRILYLEENQLCKYCLTKDDWNDLQSMHDELDFLKHSSRCGPQAELWQKTILYYLRRKHWFFHQTSDFSYFPIVAPEMSLSSKTPDLAVLPMEILRIEQGNKFELFLPALHNLMNSRSQKDETFTISVIGNSNSGKTFIIDAIICNLAALAKNEMAFEVERHIIEHPQLPDNSSERGISNVLCYRGRVGKFNIRILDFVGFNTQSNVPQRRLSFGNDYNKILQETIPKFAYVTSDLLLYTTNDHIDIDVFRRVLHFGENAVHSVSSCPRPHLLVVENKCKTEGGTRSDTEIADFLKECDSEHRLNSIYASVQSVCLPHFTDVTIFAQLAKLHESIEIALKIAQEQRPAVITDKKWLKLLTFVTKHFNDESVSMGFCLSSLISTDNPIVNHAFRYFRLLYGNSDKEPDPKVRVQVFRKAMMGAIDLFALLLIRGEKNQLVDHLSEIAPVTTEDPNHTQSFEELWSLLTKMWPCDSICPYGTNKRKNVYCTELFEHNDGHRSPLKLDTTNDNYWTDKSMIEHFKSLFRGVPAVWKGPVEPSCIDMGHGEHFEHTLTSHVQQSHLEISHHLLNELFQLRGQTEEYLYTSFVNKLLFPTLTTDICLLCDHNKNSVIFSICLHCICLQCYEHSQKFASFLPNYCVLCQREHYGRPISYTTLSVHSSDINPLDEWINAPTTENVFVVSIFVEDIGWIKNAINRMLGPEPKQINQVLKLWDKFSGDICLFREKLQESSVIFVKYNPTIGFSRAAYIMEKTSLAVLSHKWMNTDHLPCLHWITPLDKAHYVSLKDYDHFFPLRNWAINLYETKSAEKLNPLDNLQQLHLTWREQIQYVTNNHPETIVDYLSETASLFPNYEPKIQEILNNITQIGFSLPSYRPHDEFEYIPNSIRAGYILYQIDRREIPNAEVELIFTHALIIMLMNYKIDPKEVIYHYILLPKHLVGVVPGDLQNASVKAKRVLLLSPQDSRKSITNQTSFRIQRDRECVCSPSHGSHGAH
eukprot:TRINITY_DN14765_c0_g1_i1.p1 TRINITY_DN14765_c0_g1~~TRINITY_DN14765_c0_g1_i1.p1  ORF type:complete len:1143 (+),score=221.93 TRINITY_DN14765_c0_g1_i1:39-3431(+)